MPILSAEPCIFPDFLLDEEMDLLDDERQWWAVYTKARQEKALARELREDRLQVPHYLPLIRKQSLRGRRRIESHVPLFGGYLFMRGTEEERVKCLTTNRISCILPVIEQERLHRDLQQVHQLIECGAPLTAESRLQTGQKVRVTSGVMAGVEGTVVSRRARARLIVAVNFLQQGVSVELDDFLLEPI